jgi:hypothetical protein
MIRSNRRCAITGPTRSATRIPLIKRKAILLWEEAEQSSSMHKNNLFRARQAASLSFSKL